MQYHTEILLENLMFPEGPRWHENKLWFTDQHAQCIHSVDLKGNTNIIAELSDLPGGLGWLPDGRLLVVSMTQRQLLILEPAGLTLFADLSSLASFHCNDLLVDPQGRSYVGNFGYNLHGGEPVKSAEIILVSAQGEASITATDVIFPNGMVMPPDQQTLIIAETFASRLTCFDIHAEGRLGSATLWADLQQAYPDGICLDQDQGIWVACPNIGEVIRVEQGGHITDRVKPIGNPYACMLGGIDHRQLLIMSSETDDPEQAKRQRSGRVEVVEVAIAGAGHP